MCKAGAKIVDVCAAGDGSITDATGKIYKGKKIEKGMYLPIPIYNYSGISPPFTSLTP